jgi:hypothetical protein
MLERLQSYTVPITIAVSFYLFGFFVMANVLTLTERDIVVGMIAGAIGGITTLVAVLWQDRRSRLERMQAVAPVR